ncbi:RrF2 family transcriptional regulator [candidate division CSSED10-310 bacterium]|uniref:RrF2 family transcriptional regulator n=1 Tax=candidate division CSSED10-310 bacterium TaxID=2855610 RepID=A0ABV6YW94_UNCC1
MKISTKSRYGIRALYDLAIYQDNGPVQLRDIARRQSLSEKYLEQLMARLKASGLIKSIRGPHGGYLLTKPPEKIKVVDIFEILEGPLEPVPCTSSSFRCPSRSVCAAFDLWKRIYNSMKDVLEGTTLADLAQLQKSKQAGRVNMYYI